MGAQGSSHSFKNLSGIHICACLAGLEATGKGAALLQQILESSRNGSFLLPFLAFTGTFFFCKIAQVPKLLKENELFIRHTSVNLLVK